MENNKRPYIEQIVYVRVEKGDDAFYNKKDLRHDEISVSFARPDGFDNLKSEQKTARGLLLKIKKRIIEKLVPLMPPHRS